MYLLPELPPSKQITRHTAGYNEDAFVTRLSPSGVLPGLRHLPGWLL